jgi:hypothetical protein
VGAVSHEDIDTESTLEGNCSYLIQSILLLATPSCTGISTSLPSSTTFSRVSTSLPHSLPHFSNIPHTSTSLSDGNYSNYFDSNGNNINNNCDNNGNYSNNNCDSNGNNINNNCNNNGRYSNNNCDSNGNNIVNNHNNSSMACTNKTIDLTSDDENPNPNPALNTISNSKTDPYTSSGDLYSEEYYSSSKVASSSSNSYKESSSSSSSSSKEHSSPKEHSSSSSYKKSSPSSSSSSSISEGPLSKPISPKNSNRKKTKKELKLENLDTQYNTVKNRSNDLKRKSMSDDVNDGDSNWTCSSCTYMNIGSVKFCDVSKYTYTHTCIYVFIFTSICTYIHACMYTSECISRHIYIYIYMYIYVCTYINIGSVKFCDVSYVYAY